MSIVRKRIDELGEIITGNTPPRKIKEYYGNAYPFIKPTDIDLDKRYTLNPEECYSDLAFEKYKKSLIPKDSTCVVTIGSIGKKITQAHTDCFINQAMNAIVPFENYSPDYIFYLLKNNLQSVKAIDSGTSSGRENVSKSSFSSIEVLVEDDIKFQERIADILSSYDDLIENNLQRIKSLEEMAKCEYRLLMEKSEMKIELLSDLGEIITGKTPPMLDSSNYGRDVPFVKTPDMHNQSILLSTEQYLSEKGANTQPKKYLPKGSIMVSCIGTAGIVSLVGERCQTNQQINSIIPKNKFYSKFLYFNMKDRKEELEGLGSSGSTFTNVNKSKFEGIVIDVPKEKSLELFEKKVSSNFNQIQNLFLQNTHLRQIRDTLLPKLMSGQIDV